MKQKRITIIGGSGFLAKYCISELLKLGHKLKIICRNTHLAGHIRMMGPIDQLDIIKGNINLKHTIEPHIIGSDIVINFVGILNESSGDQTFNNCHAVGPKNIAEICSEHKIERLIHFSSIGADVDSDAKYQVSKGIGEKNILDNFSHATIIRPSIVFGPGDGFFTLQSKLVKLLPIVPLFSNNKFQCVYVKDIAEGLIKLLEDKEASGKIYEFGGPEVMTLKEIYQLILNTLKIKRIILPLPLSFANVTALLMKLSPSPMITFDQVKMLKKDNIVSDTPYNLSSLGITAKSSRDIISNYIS